MADRAKIICRFLIWAGCNLLSFKSFLFVPCEQGKTASRKTNKQFISGRSCHQKCDMAGPAKSSENQLIAISVPSIDGLEALSLSVGTVFSYSSMVANHSVLTTVQLRKL